MREIRSIGIETLHAIDPDTEPKKKFGSEFKGAGGTAPLETSPEPKGESLGKQKKVEDLTFEDLFRLGNSGKKFKEIILEGVADRSDGPKVGIGELTQDFNFVVARLASDNPGKTIKEVLDNERDRIYKTVSEIITPPEKKKTTPGEPSPEAKAQLLQALFILKHDIERYARAEKISIGPPNVVVGVVRNLVKGAFGQSHRSAEREKIKREIERSLLFLSSLEDSVVLNEQRLAHQIYMHDPKDRNSKSNSFILGSLDFALEYNVGYTPDLKNYVKKFKDPEPTAADVMPDRVITALRYMTEGYGAQAFDEEKSIQQWKTGTQFSPGGKGAGNYLTRGFVKSVDVKGD